MPPPSERPTPRTGLPAWLWLAAAFALGAAFAAWRNPHLIVDLANQVWNCF